MTKNQLTDMIINAILKVYGKSERTNESIFLIHQNADIIRENIISTIKASSTLDEKTIRREMNFMLFAEPVESKLTLMRIM